MCLANTDQSSAPDGQERAELQIAGLGEKRITFLADSNSLDIHLELCSQFPRLNEAGGYELLRVPEGGGKSIEVVACPEAGYTVSYLKAVVHNAKVFIRPLQINFSVEPEKEEV